MPEPCLSVDVQLSYPGFHLDVRHKFESQGVTGLFGPSGSGKSTLLRIIAGLERRARGVVHFRDCIWQGDAGRSFTAAYRRPVGYVFQDARLFSHLDVGGNLRYAAKRAGPAAAAGGYREIVTAFDLESLLQRRVRSLSGGERQRVAIARTLMTRPRLLLLDEPLAALDAKRKAEILPYLETLPRRFGIPVIYVSHAVDEIARLAERVVVLDRGRILAAGEAASVLSELGEASTTLPFEFASILQARVVEHLEKLQLTRLDHAGQSIVVPLRSHLRSGDTVRLHVRAGDVALATREPEGLSFRNVLAGTLAGLHCDPHSAFASVSIDTGSALLRAHLTRQAVQELELQPGMRVYALLKTAAFDHRASASP